VDDIYTPRAFEVTSLAAVETAVVYIEDVDTDGDGLPDSWEMLAKGGLAKTGAATGDTYYTKVDPYLVNTVTASSIRSAEGLTAEDMAVWPLFTSLLGRDVSSQSSLASAELLGMPTTVTAADVEIVSFSLEDGIVLATETETTASGNGATLAAAAVPESVTVTWELLYAPSLDAQFTTVKSGTVTLGGADSARKRISLDDVRCSSAFSEKSGFFKVRVTNMTK